MAEIAYGTGCLPIFLARRCMTAAQPVAVVVVDAPPSIRLVPIGYVLRVTVGPVFVSLPVGGENSKAFPAFLIFPFCVWRLSFLKVSNCG